MANTTTQWLKLWTDSLTDSVTSSMSNEDWGFLTRLWMYIKKESPFTGEITFSDPAFIACALLHVPNFQTLTDKVKSIANVFLNMEITVTPDCRHITLVFSNWHKKQVDSSKDRMRKKRSGDDTSLILSSLTNKGVKEGSGKPLEGNGIPYVSILNRLNERTGKHFKLTDNFKKLVAARWNEGQREEDFFTVIENKIADWKGTPYEKYIRPETIFGTKFDGYRNNPPIKTDPTRSGHQSKWEDDKF